MSTADAVIYAKEISDIVRCAATSAAIVRLPTIWPELCNFQSYFIVDKKGDQIHQPYIAQAVVVSKWNDLNYPLKSAYGGSPPDLNYRTSSYFLSKTPLGASLFKCIDYLRVDNRENNYTNICYVMEFDKSGRILMKPTNGNIERADVGLKDFVSFVLCAQKSNIGFDCMEWQINANRVPQSNSPAARANSSENFFDSIYGTWQTNRRDASTRVQNELSRLQSSAQSAMQQRSQSSVDESSNALEEITLRRGRSALPSSSSSSSRTPSIDQAPTRRQRK